MSNEKMYDVLYTANLPSEPCVAIIENFYTEEELELIWKELDTLTKENKFESGEKTSSAKDSNGQIKKNKSVFLDNLYSNRNQSNILQANRKTLHPNLLNKLIELNPIFRYISESDKDETMISYYENGDSYFKHCDSASITMLTYFYKEPKKFTGGDLILNDFNVSIECQNNMLVIFPSSYNHQVTEVLMDVEEEDGLGRYCMTQFISNR